MSESRGKPPNERLRRARESMVSPSGSGRPMSRRELADAASRHLERPMDEKYIGKLERGEHRWPSASHRSALRQALGASTDSELGLFVDRPPRQVAAPPLHRPAGHIDAEDLVTVLGRVDRLGRTIDPQVIGGLAEQLDHLVESYDQLDHGTLIPALVRSRRWADSLLESCHHPRQRATLCRIASGHAGLLGYVAVGRGRFTLANAYFAEAMHLASFAEDNAMRAWIFGLQSLGQYYAGNYHQALDLAEHGLQLAGRGPQGSRLACNGVARAAAKIGDLDRVHRAIEVAQALSEANGAPTGMPSSVSFGAYSATQVASNAATAYLALGQANEAQRYAHAAMPEVVRTGSPWSRSLVAIDLATSLASSREADLDQAGALVIEALQTSAGRPIIAVTVRATEFVRAAKARWGNTRQVEGIRDAIKTMA